MRKVFENDHFEIVADVFETLFPEAKYRVMLSEDLRNEEGEPVYALIRYGEDGVPVILLSMDAKYGVMVRVFKCQLASVAAGIEHDHDAAWLEAYNAIHSAYLELIHTNQRRNRRSPRARRERS